MRSCGCVGIPCGRLQLSNLAHLMERSLSSPVPQTSLLHNLSLAVEIDFNCVLKRDLINQKMLMSMSNPQKTGWLSSLFTFAPLYPSLVASLSLLFCQLIVLSLRIDNFPLYKSQSQITESEHIHTKCSVSYILHPVCVEFNTCTVNM